MPLVSSLISSPLLFFKSKPFSSSCARFVSHYKIKVDPFLYDKDPHTKKMIDQFVDNQHPEDLCSPIFHGDPPSPYISKTDQFSLLKQTPTHLKSIVRHFLQNHRVKVDYFDYQHRLEFSVLVRYPLRCISHPKMMESAIKDADVYEVVLFTDASALHSGSKTHFVGLFVYYWNGLGWQEDTRSKVVEEENVSEAEAAGAKFGLEYLIEKKLHTRKVIHYTDCDNYQQRLRKFVMCKDHKLFSFYSGLFDLMISFPNLSSEAIYREGNLAHYPATIARFERLRYTDSKIGEKIDEAKYEYFHLKGKYKNGNPYFIFRFNRKLDKYGGYAPPVYGNLTYHQVKFKVIENFQKVSTFTTQKFHQLLTWSSVLGG